MRFSHLPPAKAPTRQRLLGRFQGHRPDAGNRDNGPLAFPRHNEGERGLVLWLEDGATIFLGSLPHRTDDQLTRTDALGYLNRSLRNGGLNGVKEARVIPMEYQGRTGYLLVAKTSTSLLLFDETELLIASRFASTSVDNRIALLTPWVELLF